MNWNQIEGKWMKVKGLVRQNWAKLTDDDVTRVDGKREELLGRLEERYGYGRDQAEREVDAFINKIKTSKAA